MTFKSYYFTSDYERCSRLAFGVPLEDAFPADDVHPSLKELLIRAYESISLCGYRIDEILSSKLQGTVDERLGVKERVALCEPMSDVISPGAFLWVIRHFLGLIPLPLLPKYTDAKAFNWTRLSQFCRRSLLRWTENHIGEKLLVKKIAEELLRLPLQNLLLFGALLNFIRALTTKKIRKTSVNKFAALCLVRYFCSSLFIRPYLQDYNKEADKLYVPFLIYVVLKWPEIETLIKKTNAKTSSSDSENFYQQPDHLDDVGLLLTNLNLKNISTQTDESQPSTPSAESVEFLRDAGCQTEISFTTSKNRRRCCCRYGNNYETHSFARGVHSEDKIVQTDELEDHSLTGSVLQVASSQTSDSAMSVSSEQERPSREAVSMKRQIVSSKYSASSVDVIEVEYSNDERTNSDLNLLSDEDHLGSKSMSTAEIKVSDSGIFARVAKIGWTYNSPGSFSSNSVAKVESNLYFNKSLGNQVGVKVESLRASASVSSTRSGRRIGLRKITSSLYSLKFFARLKSKPTDSSGPKEASQIKYEKMNSVKSTAI